MSSAEVATTTAAAAAAAAAALKKEPQDAAEAEAERHRHQRHVLQHLQQQHQDGAATAAAAAAAHHLIKVGTRIDRISIIVFAVFFSFSSISNQCKRGFLFCLPPVRSFDIAPPPSSTFFKSRIQVMLFLFFLRLLVQFLYYGASASPSPVSRKGSNERSLGLVTSPGLSPSCVTPLRSHTYACVCSTALFWGKIFWAPEGADATYMYIFQWNWFVALGDCDLLFLAKNVVGLICSCGGKPISL